MGPHRQPGLLDEFQARERLTSESKVDGRRTLALSRLASDLYMDVDIDTNTHMNILACAHAPIEMNT